MKKITQILSVLFLCFFLTGCLGLTSNHIETNKMIAQANTDRFKAFSEGMSACGNNAACQVGLAMGFSGNLGQQAFYKPETTTDLLHAFLPYATLGVDVARLWRSTYNSGDSAGFVITGDNNQISGTANKLTADNESSVNGSFLSNPAITHQAYTLTDEAAISTTTEVAPEPMEEEVVVEE